MDVPPEAKKKYELYFKEPSAIESAFVDSKLPLVKYLRERLEKQLKLAGDPRNPARVASSLAALLLTSVFIAILLIGFGALAIREYRITLEPVYLVLGIMTFILGPVIVAVSYLVFIMNISNEISKRRTGFDAESLAFSALFFIYLRTGMSPKIMFEHISKARAFETIRMFSKYISNRIQFLGESVESAIEKSLVTVPSKVFEDLMSSYVIAVKTGAPVVETIRAKMQDLVERLKVEANAAVDRLSGVGETYVVWLASGFISIFLMVIMGAVFPAIMSMPMGFIDVLALIVLPVVNIVFVYMADSVQLKFPERPLKANQLGIYMFVASIVLIFVFLLIEGIILNKISPYQYPSPTYLLLSFLTMNGTTSEVFPTGLAITLAFVITSIPVVVMTRRELSEGTGYDIYIVRLLNSIAEGIRAGLPPEVVIKSLKDSKELGKLREVIRIAYAYIQLGVPLKDAFRKASERIIDFSSKVALNALADMTEIGNLNPETIQALAQQLDIQIRIRREYYSKIKVLIAMPYVGVLLALIANVLMAVAIESIIASSRGAAAYGPIAEASILIPKAIYLLAASSLFSAYTAGFLVGKLQTGKTATGFLHAAILTVISFVMLIVALSVHLNFGSGPTNATL